MVIGMLIIGKQLILTFAAVDKRNVFFPDWQSCDYMIFHFGNLDSSLFDLSLQVRSLLICRELFVIIGEHMKFHPFFC